MRSDGTNIDVHKGRCVSNWYTDRLLKLLHFKKIRKIFSQILNQLLDKFNEYKTIVNYRMEYIFADHSGKLYLEDILL